MRELLRPWKLLTLALGVAALLYGAGSAPDWDVPVSLLMAATAYATAPRCMRALLYRQWARWPAAVLAAWWGVDGCYAAYWAVVDPAALELMRMANAPASLALYAACGLLWLPRAPLNVIWARTRRLALEARLGARL